MRELSLGLLFLFALAGGSMGLLAVAILIATLLSISIWPVILFIILVLFAYLIGTIIEEFTNYQGEL